MNLLKTIALLTVVAKVQGLSSSSSSGHAWHFTDVHLDPLYTVNASIFNYCNGNVSQNDPLKAGVFGSSQGNCATPRTLYESAVEFMHENSQDSADIVLFTGDFTQAGLSSEMAVYETIAEAFQRLQEGFPGVKGIYGTVGNHDKYPGDVFPHPYDGYRVLASIWQPYLDSQAVETVIDGGYYSMDVNENLRIISINTNYLAALNPLVKNTSNPAYFFGFKMMDWFEDELRNASESDTNVWILGHIPFETWLPEHLNRYQRLISTYSPKTVKGQFYGHDHEDYVRLTRNCDSVCDGKASGVVWIGPALTEGYPSENPGIRQYEYVVVFEHFCIKLQINDRSHTHSNIGTTRQVFRFKMQRPFTLILFERTSEVKWSGNLNMKC